MNKPGSEKEKNADKNDDGVNSDVHEETTPSQGMGELINLPLYHRYNVPFITENPLVLEALDISSKFAQEKIPILITGETGTGKTALAKKIHHWSKLSEFVNLSSAGLTDTLVESALFGHAKGSFTGATRTKPGLIVQADKGTLFLDEISGFSLDIQTKLLTVTEENYFIPVGSVTPMYADIRIIATTNQPPEELIEKKKLRKDLYYRINGVQIHLPPLRERPEDIPLLVMHFISEFCTQKNINPLRPDDKAMKILLKHRWEGNIRELKNVIQKAIVLSPSHEICGRTVNYLLAKEKNGIQAMNPEMVIFPIRLDDVIAAYEKAVIIQVLQETNWVQKDAAAMLKITPRVMCYKMDKLGILSPLRPSPENKPARTK